MNRIQLENPELQVSQMEQPGHVRPRQTPPPPQQHPQSPPRLSIVQSPVMERFPPSDQDDSPARWDGDSPVAPVRARMRDELTPSAYIIPPPTEQHPAFSAPYDTEKQERRRESKADPPAPDPTPSVVPVRPDVQAPPAPGPHLPGQVPHPTLTDEPAEWRHGLCSCAGTDCLEAVCCPCVVYGRVQYRLHRREARLDPTDLLGWRRVNGACGGFVLACGLQWLLVLFQQATIRRAYGLTGSAARSCPLAACCGCCGVCCAMLVQSEREIREREDLATGTITTTAYAAPPQMTYPSTS